jgi:hypothetical protein
MGFKIDFSRSFNNPGPGSYLIEDKVDVLSFSRKSPRFGMGTESRGDVQAQLKARLN